MKLLQLLLCLLVLASRVPCTMAQGVVAPLDLYVAVSPEDGDPGTLSIDYMNGKTVSVAAAGLGSNGTLKVTPDSFENAAEFTAALAGRVGEVNKLFDGSGIQFKIRTIYLISVQQKDLKPHYDKDERALTLANGKSLVAAFDKASAGSQNAFKVLVASLTEAGAKRGKAQDDGFTSVVDVASLFEPLNQGFVLAHELGHNLGLGHAGKNPLKELMAPQEPDRGPGSPYGASPATPTLSADEKAKIKKKLSSSVFRKYLGLDVGQQSALPLPPDESGRDHGPASIVGTPASLATTGVASNADGTRSFLVGFQGGATGLTGLLIDNRDLGAPRVTAQAGVSLTWFLPGAGPGGNSLFLRTGLMTGLGSDSVAFNGINTVPQGAGTIEHRRLAAVPLLFGIAIPVSTDTDGNKTFLDVGAGAMYLRDRTRISLVELGAPGGPATEGSWTESRVRPAATLGMRQYLGQQFDGHPLCLQAGMTATFDDRRQQDVPSANFPSETYHSIIGGGVAVEGSVGISAGF
jgi:hypothetical protein